MKGKQYDYKEAYNKNLTPKARLHYLENARHDQDAKCPSCGSPLHSNCSPARMKYEVKDINKNGKIDGWEQAKYDAINKSSDSPAKQVVDPTMQQQMVQPMTNIPPAASSLVNPFSPQAQANAQGVFGNQQMKQNAVNAPFMYKKSSPLDQKIIGEQTYSFEKDKNSGNYVAGLSLDPYSSAEPEFTKNRLVLTPSQLEDLKKKKQAYDFQGETWVDQSYPMSIKKDSVARGKTYYGLKK